MKYFYATIFFLIVLALIGISSIGLGYLVGVESSEGDTHAGHLLTGGFILLSVFYTTSRIFDLYSYLLKTTEDVMGERRFN